MLQKILLCYPAILTRISHYPRTINSIMPTLSKAFKTFE